MRKMLPLSIGFCLLIVSPFTLAQEKRFEVSGIVGYSFSSGVDVTPQDVDGTVYDRISPKSGLSYDVGADFFITEGFSLGFNWGRQESYLRGRAQSAPDMDFTSMNVDNYHGIFTYNFGDEDSSMRPYIMGGLGATRFSPGSIDGNSVSSRTRFSSTLGGGIKLFPSEHFGFKGGVRWTPTYIGTSPGGTWCNIYYCWYVGNDHYSHQFEMNAGVVARF